MVLLRELREEAGLSQQEAADRIGILRPTLAKWEAEASCPRGDILPTIAKVYGLKSIDDMFSDREKRIAGFTPANARQGTRNDGRRWPGGSR